jgi:DNA polymerase-3 subunit epsilon
MTLTRPLCVLDTETTGVDPVIDRIIEFGCTVYLPDGSRKKYEQRFNPGMHIPEEATEIHGISDEDVKDMPPFSDHAAKIHRALQGKDIAGYNLRRLDLPLLDEELRRSELKLDLTGVVVIDVAAIFFNKEPRNLEAAVLKYCGRSHEDAHGAAADADATLDVLLGQLAMYEDLAAMELPALAAFARMGDKETIDLAGKLFRDSDGDICYAFGKSKGVKAKVDPGFGYWLLRQTSPPFPCHTCEVLRAEFERLGL